MSRTLDMTFDRNVDKMRRPVRNRYGGNNLVWPVWREIVFLDIVHGIANYNFQSLTDHIGGHHIFGGFERGDQP